MTGHRLRVLACAAAAVASLALAARPLLPHPTTESSSHPVAPAVAVPGGAVPAATALAGAAVACGPAPSRVRDCGALAVTRANAYPLRADTVVVLLVGSLRTSRTTVPVALRVELKHGGGGWRGQVRLP